MIIRDLLCGHNLTGITYTEKIPEHLCLRSIIQTLFMITSLVQGLQPFCVCWVSVSISRSQQAPNLIKQRIKFQFDINLIFRSKIKPEWESNEENISFQSLFIILVHSFYTNNKNMTSIDLNFMYKCVTSTFRSW